MDGPFPHDFSIRACRSVASIPPNKVREMNAVNREEGPVQIPFSSSGPSPVSRFDLSDPRPPPEGWERLEWPEGTESHTTCGCSHRSPSGATQTESSDLWHGYALDLSFPDCTSCAFSRTVQVRWSCCLARIAASCRNSCFLFMHPSMGA